MFTSDLEDRPPDPLVAPVAVDVHPEGHAVLQNSQARHLLRLPSFKRHSARLDSHRNEGVAYPVVHGGGGALLSPAATAARRVRPDRREVQSV